MRAFPLLALLVTVAAPAAAQVGHPPDASPYQDIMKGHSITPMVGMFGGGGGRFGIGGRDGTTYGVRYDLRAGGTISFGASVARGTLERLVVDPFVRLADRVSGPVDQKTTFADLSIQLNLTGGKTWRRIAPYAGVALGMAFGGDIAADTSDYEFGNKFYFAPHIGTRVFLTSRVLLRADARATFWKLNYPDSFADEPPLEPGTDDEPNAVIPDNQMDEWVVSPWVQVGLGFLFRL